MTRLMLAELLAQWRTWLGMFILTATAGLVLSLGMAMVETGSPLGGEFQEGLAGIAGMILVFSGISVLGVVSAVAALTVTLQQRSYALWLLLGARPLLVGAIVMAQLLLVSVLGALLGITAARPLAGGFFAWGFPADSVLHHVRMQFGVPTVVGTVALVAAVVLLGGWRAARRAALTPPLEVLREAEPCSKKMGWLRWALALTVSYGTYTLSSSLFVPDAPSSLVPLLAPAMAAVVLVLGPVLYPLVLTAWTGMVPGRVSSAWFMARHQVRYRLRYSTAAITPLFMGIALTGGLFTAVATQFGGEEIAVEQVVTLLGGPILLAAVGSAVVVFMSSRSRGQELGLLQAGGATHGTIIRTCVFESLIYVLTAALLALVVIAASGVVLAAGLSVTSPGTVPHLALGAASMVAGLGGVLVLLATLLPTVLGLRKDVMAAVAG